MLSTLVASLLLAVTVFCIEASGYKSFVNDLFKYKSKNYGSFFKSQPGLINLQYASVAEAYYMGHYSSMVYCSDKRLEKFDCSGCRRVDANVELKNIFQGNRHGSKGAVFIDTKYRKIVLAFRGSVNLKNWIQNADTNQVPYHRIPGAKVHKGFYEVALGDRQIYTHIVGELVSDPQYSNYQFSVVGHSLGGANAMLAALDLHFINQLPWPRIEVFTYGQPRTGNVNFTNFINQLPIKLARVVNENDGVPHMIPDANDFVHHGIEMYIKDKKTQYCVSQTEFESSKCSLSRVPYLSPKAHGILWDYKTGAGSC